VLRNELAWLFATLFERRGGSVVLTAVGKEALDLLDLTRLPNGANTLLDALGPHLDLLTDTATTEPELTLEVEPAEVLRTFGEALFVSLGEPYQLRDQGEALVRLLRGDDAETHIAKLNNGYDAYVRRVQADNLGAKFVP
jgi:hypothetical protein